MRSTRWPGRLPLTPAADGPTPPSAEKSMQQWGGVGSATPLGRVPVPPDKLATRFARPRPPSASAGRSNRRPGPPNSASTHRRGRPRSAEASRGGCDVGCEVGIGGGVVVGVGPNGLPGWFTPPVGNRRCVRSSSRMSSGTPVPAPALGLGPPTSSRDCPRCTAARPRLAPRRKSRPLLTRTWKVDPCARTSSSPTLTDPVKTLMTDRGRPLGDRPVLRNRQRRSPGSLVHGGDFGVRPRAAAPRRPPPGPLWNTSKLDVTDDSSSAPRVSSRSPWPSRRIDVLGTTPATCAPGAGFGGEIPIARRPRPPSPRTTFGAPCGMTRAGSAARHAERRTGHVITVSFPLPGLVPGPFWGHYQREQVAVEGRMETRATSVRPFLGRVRDV